MAVGLDFGTSTTLVAAGNRVVWIGTGAVAWMPSLVGYDEDGSVVVGEDAQFAQPGQVIRSIKRAITTRRSSVMVAAPTGLANQRADDLMALILRQAVRRARAEDLDLFDADTVHLGCPAMWDGRQRRRLIEIAQTVGLPVTLANLVDEPVAAGLAWLDRQSEPAPDRRRVVVFDMGGGTLDVAVLDVHGRDRVSVLAAAGIAEAGDALDEEIADDLDDALALAGVDVGFPRAHIVEELLLDAARRLKQALTIVDEDVVVLPPDIFGHHEIWYTRQQLDAAFSSQLDRAQECVAATLRAARLNETSPEAAADIARTPVATLVAGVDVVVLAGGMSRVPTVAARLREFFPPTTRIELATPEPEVAVVLGLASSARYGRTNRHRPAFDVLVEWDQGRESRVVYEAFLPVVESYQIVRGDADLRYIRDGRELNLPAAGAGNLRLVSQSGEPVAASMNGGGLDGFRVAFNGEAFEFSLYPTGRVRVVDGNGTHHGQVHYP